MGASICSVATLQVTDLMRRSFAGTQLIHCKLLFYCKPRNIHKGRLFSDMFFINSRATPVVIAVPEPTHARVAGAANQTQILGDFYRLDVLTLRWTLLSAGVVQGSPPAARYSHGLAAVFDKVYVFGGFQASGEGQGSMGQHG
jgi:hypothetical protein